MRPPKNLGLGCLGCLPATFTIVHLLAVEDVFGLTAMATCIFNVVKAGLYACQDFKYMAVASLWAPRRSALCHGTLGESALSGSSRGNK